MASPMDSSTPPSTIPPTPTPTFNITEVLLTPVPSSTAAIARAASAAGNTQTPILVVVALLCLMISTGAVAIRTFTKSRRVGRGLRYEDYALITSHLLFIAFTGITAAAFSHNTSITTQSPSSSEIWGLARMACAAQIIYAVMSCLAKLALCVDLRRLLVPRSTPSSRSSSSTCSSCTCEPRRTWVWYASWEVIVISVGVTIGAVVALIIAVSTGQEQWNTAATVARRDPQDERRGGYVDVDAVLVAWTAVDAALNCMLFVLPIGAVSRLSMPPRRRCGVALLFLVGAFAVVAGVVKLVYTVEYSFARSEDRADAAAYVALWSFPEQAATLFVASALSFPRFSDHICGRLPSVQPYEREVRIRREERSDAEPPSYAESVRNSTTQVQQVQQVQQDVALRPPPRAATKGTVTRSSWLSGRSALYSASRTSWSDDDSVGDQFGVHPGRRVRCRDLDKRLRQSGLL